MKKKLLILSLISALCLLLPLSLSGCTFGGGTATGKKTSSSSSKGTALSFSDTEMDGVLYMVTDTNTAEESITLKDLSTGRLTRYSYNLLTKFRNRYGGNALVTDFYPGRVVELSAVTTENGRILKAIMISDKAFELDEVTNYNIDTQRNVFSTMGSNYRLTSDTVVLDGNVSGDISIITENDTLKVIGTGHDIISIVITTGHGYLLFSNTTDFADSLMQIGSRIFVMVSPEPMTIEVPEGDYAVTVANKGYGGTKDVTVPRGDTVVVDLMELKGEGPKTCDLSFRIDVPGAMVYLDNQPVSVNETMQVPYGAHSLKVTADGYDTWTRTLYVNSKSAEITLDISDSKKGESSKTSSSSSSSVTSADSRAISSAVSSALSSAYSSSAVSGDLDGDGDYDADDAELQYLQSISNMLSTLSSSDNDL